MTVSITASCSGSASSIGGRGDERIGCGMAMVISSSTRARNPAIPASARQGEKWSASTDTRGAFPGLMPLSQDRMREDHLTRTFEEKVEALSVIKRVKGGSSNGNSIKRQRLDP